MDASWLGGEREEPIEPFLAARVQQGLFEKLVGLSKMRLRFLCAAQREQAFCDLFLDKTIGGVRRCAFLMKLSLHF